MSSVLELRVGRSNRGAPVPSVEALTSRSGESGCRPRRRSGALSFVPRRGAGLGAGLVPVKAEVVLAILTVVRHRSARLVSLFGLAMIGLLSLGRMAGNLTPHRYVAEWIILGALAAVWFSRLNSRGGPREAARLVASSWWVVPTGRLLGGSILLVPAVTILGLVLLGGGGNQSLVRFSVSGIFFALALGSFCMILTPLLGASGAASLGITLALIGSLGPDVMPAPPGNFLQMLSLVFDVLPFQWRADRWLNGQESVVVLVPYLLWPLTAAIVGGAIGRRPIGGST